MLVAAHRLRRQIGVNFPRYGSETVENLRREQAATEQIAAAVEAGRPMAVDNGAIAGALFGAQTVEQAVVEDRREDLEPARVARAGKAAAGRPRRHRRGLPLVAAVLGDVGLGHMLGEGDRLAARRRPDLSRRWRAGRFGGALRFLTPFGVA